MNKRLPILILVLSFLNFQARAEIPGMNISGYPSNGGAEYFVGRIEGKPLIKVHLLGGSRAPGVYHIPIQTNLAQFLAFAGGVADGADLDEVTIRSSKSDKSVTQHFDMTDMINNNEPFPTLAENDTIYIKVKPDPLNRTALWVGIGAGLISIVLSAIIINKSTNGQ